MRLPLVTAVLLASAATPLVAQTATTINLRVDKLEKEMKAVQRKVFPNGVSLQPEIGAADGTAAAGTANPVADLTARVDSLESQLRSLTGQVETNDNRLKKLEDAVKTLKTEADTRLKVLEGTGAVPMSAASPSPVVSAPLTTSATPAPTTVAAVAPKPAASAPVATATPKPAVATKTPAATAKPEPTATKPATAAKPDPNRKAAIAAVEIPDTGDAAEDAYSYGFRLWSAKLYPEAQVKLREFSQKYASHKRASYAQNLLGRAYLDEGKPNLASVTFYENYTKNPKGERASESLYWLGVALTRLKKLPDACKVYDEFNDVYGAKAAADLKSRVAKGRTDAKCAA